MDDTNNNNEDKTLVTSLPASAQSQLLKSVGDDFANMRLLSFGDGKAINPLVNAAAPLLLIMAQLKRSIDCADVSKLREKLQAEVKAFESKSKAANIPDVTIMVARYALCSSLDETILKLLLNRQNLWANQTLLGTFHKDAGGGEKFFTILERLSQDPALNQDVLELMALCLELGFEGKYRVMQGGQNQLSMIKAALAKRIARIRATEDAHLNVECQAQQVKKRLGVNINFRKLILILAGTLLGLFIIFYIAITIKAHPAMTTLEQVNQVTQHSKVS